MVYFDFDSSLNNARDRRWLPKDVKALEQNKGRNGEARQWRQCRIQSAPFATPSIAPYFVPESNPFTNYCYFVLNFSLKSTLHILLGWEQQTYRWTFEGETRSYRLVMSATAACPGDDAHGSKRLPPYPLALWHPSHAELCGGYELKYLVKLQYIVKIHVDMTLT